MGEEGGNLEQEGSEDTSGLLACPYQVHIRQLVLPFSKEVVKEWQYDSPGSCGVVVRECEMVPVLCSYHWLGMKRCQYQ